MTIRIAFIVALALAAGAQAQPVDWILSGASFDPAATDASILVYPNGGGTAITEAYSTWGAHVDATITLWLYDIYGNPMVGIPADDLWLKSSEDGLAFCPGGTIADHATDVHGETTWSNPLHGGGSSGGERLQVVVMGSTAPGPGLQLTCNSPDMNGDLEVNLSDVTYFTQAFSTYTYAGDFNNDGVINLADIVRFTAAIGTVCP